MLSSADNDAMLGKTMPEKWHYLKATHGITDSETTFRDACAATYMTQLSTCPQFMYRAYIRLHPIELDPIPGPNAVRKSGLFSLWAG